MNPAPIDTQLAPEGVLAAKDVNGYELIDGESVEKIMGAQASRVVQIVNSRVFIHAEANRLGLVFASDAGYQIFPDKPNLVRKPDGSFIRSGRLPDNRPPRGYLHIAPDLTIEVVSPNDLAENVEERASDFLKAGTKLLWLFYPSTRTVYVFRQGTSMSRLASADELTGEDVLPGFVCRVEEFFAGI